MTMSPDDDLVTMRCNAPKCGHEFEMAWDAMMMAPSGPDNGMYCGGCGESKGFECIKDPAKEEQKKRILINARRPGKNSLQNAMKEISLKPLDSILEAIPGLSNTALVYLMTVETNNQNKPRKAIIDAIGDEAKRRGF